MEPTRRERAQEIFAKALSLPAEERMRHVSRACAGDDELRERVESLLDVVATEDEAATIDEALLEMPQSIGDYHVLRLLGHGGMGIVYEAEQEKSQQRVAIKVLRPGAATPRMLEAFRREGELLGRLRHPGMARVHETGEARPWGERSALVPYIVMELVEGSPMTSHAAMHRMDVTSRLELLARTCDAVHHAHQQGVVHRDLKPSNVLIDERGQPRVLDFGFARVFDADTQAIGSGNPSSQAVGTLAYMSPEQLDGRSEDVGPRSDVHALGVLAHELLVGRPPHALTGLPIAEAMQRIRSVDPPLLGTIDRELAGDVEAIVAKALEKDPARRHASAAELAAEIRRHLAHEPIRSRVPNALDRVRKLVHRNPTVALAVGATVAALALATVVSTWMAFRATRSQRLAEAAATEARQASYRARLGSAIFSLAEGDAPAARSHLESTPAEMREWTWHHVAARLDDSVSAVDTGLGEELRVEQLVAREDGALVAVGDAGVAVLERTRRELRLTHSIRGERFRLARDGTQAIELRDGAWLLHDLVLTAAPPTSLGGARRSSAVPLHDGSWLVADEGALRVHARDGSVERRIAFEPKLSLHRHDTVVSPDDRWLAAGLQTGEFELFELRDGDRVHELGKQHRVAFTPDAERLLSVSHDGFVYCWKTGSFEPCAWERVAASTRRMRFIAIDDAGRRFVTIDDAGVVRLWNVADGTPVSTVTVTGHGAREAFFAPGGTAVVVPSITGRLHAHGVQDARALSVSRLGHATVPVDVAWLRDEGWLASLDQKGEVRLYFDPTSGDPRHLEGHQSYVYGVDVGANGIVASVGWDYTARTWDAGTGRLLETFTVPKRDGRAVRIHPDGTVLSSHRGQLLAWEPRAGTELARLEFEGHVLDIAIDARGETVALAHERGTFSVWNGSLTEKMLERRLRVSRRGQSCRVALSAGGRTLAMSVEDQLRVVDLRSGERRWETTRIPGSLMRIAFSADSTRLVGTGAGFLVVFDAMTGSVERLIDAPGGITYGLALHPDGRTAATGSRDGVVRTWDLLRGEQVARLRAHRDYVYDVRFSPDGSLLASASGDGSVHLWDTLPLGERLALTESR